MTIISISDDWLKIVATAIGTVLTKYLYRGAKTLWKFYQLKKDVEMNIHVTWGMLVKAGLLFTIWLVPVIIVSFLIFKSIS